MIRETEIGIIDFILIIGVFQGLLLGYFFLRYSNQNKSANLYQGIFLVFLSLAIFEEFLNNTGYIVQLIPIANFAEPFNLAYGPLFFLFIKRSLIPGGNFKKDWYHFIIFLLYLGYMVLYFSQPEAIKYNSYIYSKHPNWPQLEVNPPFPEDPLGLRSIINLITAIHLTLYLALTSYMLWFGNVRNTISNQNFNEKLKELKSTTLHLIILIGIFIGTKLYYGRDLGDYFITSYATLLFVITTIRIMRKSGYFSSTHSFLDLPVTKYKKSSLSEERKNELLKKIQYEFQNNHYYADNLASLSNLAKRLNVSTHHISQVINEKLTKNFYELIAYYRIEEAKILLLRNKNLKMTIEEIAEQVGYNSKSAFNKAFKNHTGQTPSEYRKNNG